MSNKIAVIGAGVVGLSIALRLSKQRYRVTLIDPSPAGRDASFGNAGCLSPSTVTPLAMPGVMREGLGMLFSKSAPLSVQWSYLPSMGPWIHHFSRVGTVSGARFAAHAIAPLIANSAELYRDLIGKDAAARLIRQNGSLIVYRSREAWEGSKFSFELRVRNGVSWEEIEGRDLSDFDPALTKGLFKGVIFPENGHCTDPGALLSELLEQFRTEGGQVLLKRAAGIEPGEHDGIVHLEDGQQIRVGKAIVAAGVGSIDLARGLGDRVLLQPERGYHAMLHDPTSQPRLPTMDAERKIVVTPMERGVRIAGVAEFVRPGSAPNWALARNLLAQGRALFPALAPISLNEEEAFWAGNRPSTPDSMPVIGTSSKNKRVIYAFGHGHVGFMSAPKTAKIVSDIVTDRVPDIDISPFDARRFRKSTWL